MAASSSSDPRPWPVGKTSAGKTVPNPAGKPSQALENMKDPCVRQYLDKLVNPFHAWMKKAGYEQQLNAHVGSLSEKPDSPTIVYCSYVNAHPEEMSPGAVAMGDPKRIKAIKQALKAKRRAASDDRVRLAMLSRVFRYDQNLEMALFRTNRKEWGQDSLVLPLAIVEGGWMRQSTSHR